MKYYISLIIISLIITSCQKQEEIIINHPFVNEYIQSLDKDDKTLILEFWASTCSPCIKLKNDIFENDQNTDFLNDNFILLKVSPSDSIYKSLYNYYKLNAQSTVLYFNSKGEEIERSVGYDGNKDVYMSFLNDITKRENLYSDVYKNYVEDSTDIKYNFLLAKKRLFRYENKKAIEHFNYIINNDSDNAYGYQSECLFRIAEYEFLNKGNIKNVECYVNSFSDSKFLPQAYLYLINHFKNKKDHKNSVITSAEALRKFPFNTDLLNKHAWNIYLFRIEEDYKEALEMIEKAIGINPNIARYWDTQAWLYFEIGEKGKAAQSEQKAIDLFPHSAYKQALKNFKSV